MPLKLKLKLKQKLPDEILSPLIQHEKIKDVTEVKEVNKCSSFDPIHFEFKAMTQNSYYKKFRNKLVISKEGRTYREKIQNKISELTQITGQVALLLDFEFKDRRKRDLDNLHKCLIDAIKDRLIEDDDQVFKIFMTKKISQSSDRFTLRVVRPEQLEIRLTP